MWAYCPPNLSEKRRSSCQELSVLTCMGTGASNATHTTWAIPRSGNGQPYSDSSAGLGLSFPMFVLKAISRRVQVLLHSRVATIGGCTASSAPLSRRSRTSGMGPAHTARSPGSRHKASCGDPSIVTRGWYGLQFLLPFRGAGYFY
jgi:hypothetical protein